MRVLFVDDEDDIRELIEFAIMTEDDIEPTFAATGLDAIATMETQSFDVIMLDVMMPPPDGMEVLRCARANADLDDTKIVMCTAKTSCGSPSPESTTWTWPCHPPTRAVSRPRGRSR